MLAFKAMSKRDRRDAGGKSKNKDSGRKSSQKREVKNARGLRDVLGVPGPGSSSSGRGGISTRRDNSLAFRASDRFHSSRKDEKRDDFFDEDSNERDRSSNHGPRGTQKGRGTQRDGGRFNERDDRNSRDNRESRNRRDDRDERQDRTRRGGYDKPDFPERDQTPKDQSKGPQSKKLTYIMNFQPPPDAKAEAKPQPSRGPKAEPPRPQGRSLRGGGAAVETEPSREPARPGARAKRTEIDEVLNRKDFRWPAERIEVYPGQGEEKKSRKYAKGTGNKVTGFIKRHPDGFGFLIPDVDDHPDVYISRQGMTGIMTNDRVEIEVYQPKSAGRGRDDRLSGEITKIVKRANRKIVGKYLPVDLKYGVILDDNKGWGADLRIAAKDSLGAKEGDMVAVEVIQYPGMNTEFSGKVVEILGDKDDPVNDVIRVIHENSIPTEFSAAAHEEARRFPTEVTDAECKGREDITDIDLITIDGATARDFDDAVFCEQTKTGFRLVVAIADVSHYVKPGTDLDQDAYERGTSTYFPNFVVPMLPEELSNELCSLKPNVRRLCFCCEMFINYNGEVEKYRFFEGVMHSKARVTYGEAQEVIDAHAAGQKDKAPKKFAHVADNILRCADLAKILMNKRFREGSLDLEIPETQVVVDASGETNDIIRSHRLFAHRLIEELMLVTNICTARFMDENEIPGIYRVHEEPDPDAIKSLQRYLWNLGGSRSVLGGKLQKKLTKALQSMEGKPEAQIVNILTLRTMQQARYSQENVGHFGLGFSHYSHFTSPIRRYPDLIAHRQIKSQLYPRYRTMEMSEDEIASASTFLSGCEQRSVKAERRLISIKKARFIRRFVGEEFSGIISSVAKFGVFVLLRQYDVDGLIKIENLGPDRFVFDDESLRLIGNRTGLRYTIGDVIRVRVMGASVEDGKVDFELAEPIVIERDDEDEEHDDDQPVFSGDRRSEERPRGKKGRKARGQRLDAKERGKAKNDSRGVRKERVSKRRRKN